MLELLPPVILFALIGLIIAIVRSKEPTLTGKIAGGLRAFRFKWQPSKDTAIAFVSGLIVIALSLALLPFGGTRWEGVAFLALRDLVMIFGFGFAVPIYYTLFVERNPLSELGITRRRWVVSLVVNIVLAALFALIFASEAAETGQTIALTPAMLGAIFYIMVSGIFEMLFFYGFLQLRFERGLGVIPAIILAAVLYSLHHAGFQPEFGKLFLVGVMFMTVFRYTRNLLILYPFYWGVGACWDVLVQFGAAPEQLRWTNALVVLGLMVVAGAYFHRRATCLISP
jgi:membrane protease YdiL (CAAX protease family)